MLERDRRRIFFNEKDHKYTDDLGNLYISTTTQIGSYKEGFKTIDVAKACEKIGRNPNHPKYRKYKGKSFKQLIAEWDKTKKDACDKGNERHNYLEDSIKTSTGYKKSSAKNVFRSDRIYTIDDIIANPDYGVLTIDDFIEAGVRDRYPDIFNTMIRLHDKGYKFYAEVCVYNYKLLKAGLIDNMALKYPDFAIIDWKTNRDDLRWDAGYYDKDENGQVTEIWIPKDEYYYEPLSHLQTSKLNEYTLQLSDYANMAEGFGLNYKGSILCHIREQEDKSEKVEFHQLPYFKKEVRAMANHYYDNNIRETRRTQISLTF